MHLPQVTPPGVAAAHDGQRAVCCPGKLTSHGLQIWLPGASQKTQRCGRTDWLSQVLTTANCCSTLTPRALNV
jgi:hypothetical protein